MLAFRMLHGTRDCEGDVVSGSTDDTHYYYVLGSLHNTTNAYGTMWCFQRSKGKGFHMAATKRMLYHRQNHCVTHQEKLFSTRMHKLNCSISGFQRKGPGILITRAMK